MHCVKVSDSTFNQEVLAEKKLVLVDFWAEWCGPCRMIAPVLESLAQEMASSLKVCKVDIDENPESPTKFGVRSIPTLCLFKEGQLISTQVGALPKNTLVEWIQKNS
jgi:thioredoxin 1